MNSLKISILAFLQFLPESPFEQFNKGFELYRQLPNKSRTAEFTFNKSGYSERSLKNLLYDLQKLSGITDVEILNKETQDTVMTLVPATAFDKFIEGFNKLDQEVITKTLILMKVSDQYGEEIVFSNPLLLEFFKGEFESLSELAESVKDLDKSSLVDNLVLLFENEIKAVNYPEDLQLILDGLEKQVLPLNPDDNLFNESLSEVEKEALKFIGTSVDQTITSDEYKSVREEFPFLNEKDCPDVLFVIVGRRITSYRAYQNLHNRLQEINDGKIEATEEEKLQLTLDVEAAFNENRKLWDELNHYNLNKEFLGVHPIFREDNIKKEVEIMTADELFKYRQSSATFFTRKRKELFKYADDADKLAEVKQDIDDREYKLSLVNAKIGSSNAGTEKK